MMHSLLPSEYSELYVPFSFPPGAPPHPIVMRGVG